MSKKGEEVAKETVKAAKRANRATKIDVRQEGSIGRGQSEMNSGHKTQQPGQEGRQGEGR